MSDEVNIKTPLFSFGIKKKEFVLTLNEGETKILRYWSWRKFGYIRKAVTLKDGEIQVQVI